MGSVTRYAIYYAPGGELWRRASAWLGRDARAGPSPGPLVLPGISGCERLALTESPRRYGLHATLKPPFRLAPGGREADLLAAVAALGACAAPIALPPLEVAALGTFIALRPGAPVPAVEALAAACVREIDRFRAPATPAERERRRSGGLTARQERYLRAWGYPYVLDEYRFHITLTGPVPDDARRERLVAVLRTYLDDVLALARSLDALTVYRQPEPREPFVVLERFALGR